MSATIAPYRSQAQGARAGFPQLLRAEWTKFRTVRSWMVGLVVAALLLVGVGLLSALSSHRSCGGPNGPIACPTAPVGPDGEAVSDAFYFVHQSLVGDGSITARVTGLSSLSPWSKAGVIVKNGTGPGSAYAAVLVTSAHGVRMQYDFTHDTAGLSGEASASSPRWLRLTRAGSTLTGYDSADGSNWSLIGTARLAGLPSTVQIGLFATSPEAVQTISSGFGGSSGTSSPSTAVATLDQVSLQGGSSGADWKGDDVGSGARGQGSPSSAGFQQDQATGAFTVRGSGDIAPAVGGPMGDGEAVERTLVGTFAGLVVVIVLGTLFITAEYRRGLIRTTLTASQGRGRVLAAKAVVAGAVAFTTGVVAATVAIPLCVHILKANGNVLYPVGLLTELRLVVGTGALLAVAAVLALAVGTILRRSAGAVTIVIAVIVLPYILASASVLPAGPSEWLLRITPAAGFAIQQSLRAFIQVDSVYTPSYGYFPLSPWAGLAVMCCWAALALGVAAHLLRRRDA
ncbi:ABC-type transport system involved in multi-copper enzyme maturation permease subunit [Streptomyces sp. 846.5]|nr:ABC transporter permease subunit [Streptomyces sp. 846.5]TDU03174.1 ABC-type transport system involved in multi-copper enzyme maturation permease subunit [Streptomyces sp. 846.5]